MFCRNCGNKLENGTMFCGKCGTPVQQVPRGNPLNMEVNSMTGAVQRTPHKGKKTLWTIIIVIAVAVAVVLVGSHIYGVKSGYKKALKQYIKSMEKFDDKLVYDVTADAYYDYLAEAIGISRNYLTVSEHTDKKDLLGNLDYIDDCSTEVEVKEVKTATRGDIATVEDEYADYGVDINIDKMVEVDLYTNVTYETSDKKTHEEGYDGTVYIGLVDNEWYVVWWDGNMNTLSVLIQANEEYE